MPPIRRSLSVLELVESLQLLIWRGVVYRSRSLRRTQNREADAGILAAMVTSLTQDRRSSSCRWSMQQNSLH